MITRKTISKIILANVLEMPLNKYLEYIDNVVNGKMQGANNHTNKNSKLWPLNKLDSPVLGNVSRGQDRLSLRIADSARSACKIYKIPKEQNDKNDKLVCSLNWINTRNRFTLHIINSLLQYQKAFWLSGRDIDLKPLTLKQFLTIYPLRYLDRSRLSRSLQQLYVRNLRHEVISLRNLFLSPKRIHAFHIRELIHTHEKISPGESDLTDANNSFPTPLRDKDIQLLLARRGVHLSVRTICNCRKHLGIPCYYQRSMHYYGKDIQFSHYIKLIRGQFQRIPANNGIYELSIAQKICYVNNDSNILYIGSSKNLRKRLRNHSCTTTKNIRLQRFANGSELFARYHLTENYLQVESALLRHFKKNYGELPKANKLGG